MALKNYQQISYYVAMFARIKEHTTPINNTFFKHGNFDCCENIFNCILLRGLFKVGRFLTLE